MHSSNTAGQFIIHTNNKRDQESYYLEKQEDLKAYLNSSSGKQTVDNNLGVLAAIDAWELHSNTKLTMLNQCTDNKKRNLGMMIALLGDNRACQAYLTYIKKLYNDRADDLYSFLAIKCTNGETLGTFIASYCDHETLKQYLDLLISLKDNSTLTIHDLFALLSYNPIDKVLSIGSKVCADRKKESVMIFLTTLTTFIEMGMAPADIIKYLMTLEVTAQTAPNIANSSTISHAVAAIQAPETAQYYLSFLEKCIKQHSNQLDILALIRWNALLNSFVMLRTRQGATVGHYIANSQDATTIIQYCRFLETINKTDSHFNLTNVLRDNGNGKIGNMYTYMVQKQNGENLYQLICENIFTGMENKSKLAEKKEVVFDYIMSLPFDEKLQALKNSLTPTHPLHDFFILKRTKLLIHSFSPSIITQIQAELDKLNIVTLIKDASAKFVKEITLNPSITDAIKKEFTAIPLPINLSDSSNIAASASAAYSHTSSYYTITQTPQQGSLYPVYMGHDHFTNPTHPTMTVVADTAIQPPSYFLLPHPTFDSHSDLLQANQETNLLPVAVTPQQPKTSANISLTPPSTSENKSVSVSQFSLHGPSTNEINKFKKPVNTHTQQEDKPVEKGNKKREMVLG